MKIMFSLSVSLSLSFFLLIMSIPALSAVEKPRRPADAIVIDTLVLPAETSMPAGKSVDDFKRDSTVTSRRDGDGNVTEYRLKGKLYKMMVKPAKGPAYTLIDEKGDGKFVASGKQTPAISVPMWVLLSW